MSAIVNFSCRPTSDKLIEWDQLPVIPDSTGFAGSFAGVSNGSLLVAGGSNFPANSRPWSGGTKTWYDKIFVLGDPKGGWKEVGRLPRPMGYGISLSWKDGVIILGGADKDKHYAESYFIRYVNDSIIMEDLPSLPSPNANACGVIIDDIIYVAGGLASPSSKETLNAFWSLDLSKPALHRAWHKLVTWPGAPRMLAVAGAMNGEFYLMSGVHLAAGTDDTLPHREYLKDAYAYAPGKGWRKLSDLPYPTAAAPSPAYTSHEQGLLIIGGDDGIRADSNTMLKDKHPGFKTSVLAYRDNNWSSIAEVPTHKMPDPENNPNNSTWAPVTTPQVLWNGDIVIPGGEVRPGVRTNRVLRAKVNTNQ
ncbi:MAG: galactose oxidase [Chitinophagaceae bacterium]|nr:MAG: galactose oxidase [Chitinophagaceae bacterium]